MFAQTFLTHVALAADAVDGTDHAFANPFLGVLTGAFFDDADELVAEDAVEIHVALTDFQIGGTDAHERRANDRFPEAALRWTRIRAGGFKR